MKFLRWIVAGLVFWANPAAATEIENRCFANAWESCYLVITGPIGADAAVLFAANAAQMDGNKVLFNSAGGDAIGAMALGRLIRERGYETYVGHWNDFDNPTEGACMNACLYAFLGGEYRAIAPGSRIVFEGIDAGFGVGSERDKRIVEATQHLIAMGATPDLLLRDDVVNAMTPDEIAANGITFVPPTGFGHFFIEPYRDGIIAASKRLDNPTPYNRPMQLTAFCRDNYAQFMMTAVGDYMPDDGDAHMSFQSASTAGADPSETTVGFSRAERRTWTDGTSGFVQFSLDPSQMPNVEDLTRLEMRYALPRVSGGVQHFSLDLNDTDRQMLSAALRFCI